MIVFLILKIGLCIFIIYNGLLLIFPLNKKYIYKDKERAEEYIYSKKPYPIVFVGSGLIGDFNNVNLGYTNYFNLYFPYNGSCTGIELIALTQKIPKTLFIETNYIFKGFNKELVKKLFQPIPYRLKFILPSFQEKNKLQYLLKEIFKPGKGREKNLLRLPHPLFHNSLEKFRMEYNKEIDTNKCHKIIEEFKRYITYISSEGCSIIFFEMPVEPEFLDCPKTKFERALLKTTFSDKKFIWIQTDSHTKYNTVDGIHLLDESLQKYISYLNSKLNCK